MTYLYLATDGDLLKIGISERPERRVRDHGKTVRLIETWERPYAKELERAIKGIMSYCCVRGAEWFSISEKEMLFQIRRTIRIHDDDVAISEGREPSPRPEAQSSHRAAGGRILQSLDANDISALQAEPEGR